MEPLYETSSSFGGIVSEGRPQIIIVNVPEAKKRRQPTKHYVYKIVVNWSNGQSTVIYRRYSMFFDFMVKLQELYSNLKESNPAISSQFPLPDLPGKVLFGRSEVHQVAEKRRVKVEEFCQTLVSLPSEISRSSLVIGFFNTWPDDTLHHSHAIHKGTTSPSSSTTALTNGPTSPTDLVISHPDEMENLEQYRVIANYARHDSHHVDLKAGDVVHVIEKHDTGWWMIVTEDEQGYAPAAYLEAIDNTYDSLEPECSSNEEYEAMESYIAQSEDEIGLSVGDKVTVIHKSMDGWWKIRRKGRTGYCPATVIRRAIEMRQQHSSVTSNESFVYESEKSIYEGLNIHKPPPRRNTICRQDDLYVVPKSHVTTSNTENTSAVYYKVPRPSQSSSGSDEDRLGIYSSQAFSPDHYEMGPSDSEETPIYENAEFDHPLDPSEGVVHESVYQNTSFEGVPVSPVNNKLALKQTASPQQKRSQQKPIPPPNKPTAHKSSKSHNDLDDEYINPEEFSIADDDKPNKPTIESTSSRVKYVSILTSNPATSLDTINNDSNVSVKTKARLTGSKSVSVMDRSTSSEPEDEEYISMDPVYAPVAPDEPDYEESDTMLPVETIITKKTRPPIPVPYNKKKSPEVAEGTPPQGRVLQRTKSLEDLLFKASSEGKGSPLLPRKDPVLKPLAQLGRNAPPSNGYDHIKPLPNPKPAQGSKKPEAAKKKPYHKFKIPGSDPRPEPVISSPIVTNKQEEKMPTPPPPTVPPPVSSKNQKTYTAIEDYTSQAHGCLSFTAGERCVLIKQSTGGWWYVNISGQEGWTPGEFWEEEKRAMTVASAQPPLVPPQKLLVTKIRSNTTASISDVPTLPALLQHSHSVDSQSVKLESPLDQRLLQSKARGPPPPKPKPITASPPDSRKLEHAHSVHEMKLGSPPPPPPPRRVNSQANGLAAPQLSSVPNDYGLLTEATLTPLDECSWFVGGMERERAEQFLIDNGKQREFLVRERIHKKGYFALSIRYHYSVKHFNIDPKPDGSYAMGVMQFKSIEEIIKHYQGNSLFVQEGQSVTLGQPVKRKPSKFLQH